MPLKHNQRGLGKGLGSLLPNEPDPDAESGAVSEIKINDISPNRAQPRKNFDREKLAALSESVREHGVIQPILVTPAPEGGYTIVAGERRWRAAHMAGLKTIPAVVRDYAPSAAAEVALIENLQREDLNPIEEALGYKSLMDDYAMTQENIALRIGKSRSAVANSLRLLRLEPDIQKLISEGILSGGHARAVLSLDDGAQREQLVKMITEQDLSVRRAEELAKHMPAPKKPPKVREKDAYALRLEEISEELSGEFGTRVNIAGGRKKGKIEIEYYGREDLERILNRLKGC